MKQFTSTLLGIGLSGSLLPAQAGPGPFAPYTADTVFTVSNLAKKGVFYTNATIRRLDQINFTKTPSVDKVGQWTVTMTIEGLSTTYGGVGTGSTQYVMMGQYDATKTPHTFTPNTQANRMNNTSNGNHFGLMLEPRDALCCAVDQRDGIYFSARKNVASAFPAPVKVSVAPNTPAVPAGFYVDPAAGYVDNKLVLFYTDKVTRIIMRELKLTFDTNGNLTAAQMQAVNTVSSFTIRPHSPTPMIDKAGNVQGLWMAQNVGGDSDMFFLPGLTSKDVAVKVYDTVATWLNNGGVAGGRLFFADYGTTTTRYLAAQVGRVAWLLGSNTSLGGTATMTCGVHNPQRPFKPVVTQVALALGVAPPIPFGGFNGMLAVRPPFLLLIRMISFDADETAHWSAPVPNDTRLIGRRIAVQGLSAPTGQTFTLTNTATLEIKK